MKVSIVVTQIDVYEDHKLRLFRTNNNHMYETITLVHRINGSRVNDPNSDYEPRDNTNNIIK